MTRALLLPGFSIGVAAAERIADELSPALFEEIDYFTLPQAVNDPDAVRRCAKDAVVIGQSAGFSGAAGTAPRELYGIGASLPRSRARLVAGVALKAPQMIFDAAGIDDMRAAMQFTRESLLELNPLTDHGRIQWHQFNRGLISAMDAVVTATRVGCPAWLAYGQRDLVYRLKRAERAAAGPNVNFLELHSSNKQHETHDAFILSPRPVMYGILDAAARERKTNK